MGSVRTLSRRIFIFAVLTAIILIAPSVGMRAAVAPFISNNLTDLPHADAAVILGASVIRGEPSPVLASRADAAIALYREGKVTLILVTGDNGESSYDEVTPVREYLIKAGIPEQDIVLDRAGYDTYSSMFRARNVFLSRSLIIVTQDFHLPRAVFLARAFGVEAHGLPAAQGGTIFDYIREVPASWKATWDLVLHRLPLSPETFIPVINPAMAFR